MKWNPTNLLTTRLLLGLLGISPILLLSNTTQALSAPANQLSTAAIHKATAKSTQRAIAARQQPSPYPDSLPKGVKVSDNDQGGITTGFLPPLEFLKVFSPKNDNNSGGGSSVGSSSITPARVSEILKVFNLENNNNSSGRSDPSSITPTGASEILKGE